jgi:predicted RecA/RadA family phage recombinase
VQNGYQGFSTSASKSGLNKDGVFEIPLAQTGEGIAECEVLKWNVKEGQEVNTLSEIIFAVCTANVFISSVG